MSTCETCGHSFDRAAADANRQQERIRQYRRALMIACNRSRERTREVMSQAEDELFGEPNESNGARDAD